MESDVSYFRRRATDEKAAALTALHWQARQRHLEMAERYHDFARAIAARHQHFGLSLVDYPQLDPPR
jgi:hypothetical protein